MLKRFVVVALLLAVPVSHTMASEGPGNLLARSESLLSEGEFLQSLMVLEPLLAAAEESSSQEEAFWRANALCDTLVNDYILLRRFVEERGQNQMETRHLEWEKVVTLNRLGADISFDHLATNYRYGYGFLKRLIESYPNTSRRVSADYYLIERRYNSGEAVEKWLRDLRAYVESNPDSGVIELHMAYLDIAHINDNLWQILTHPGEYSQYFTGSHPRSDREKAARCKKEALRYYAKVIVSGYSRRFGYYDSSDVTIRRFQDLKQNKTTNRSWIIYD